MSPSFLVRLSLLLAVLVVVQASLAGRSDSRNTIFFLCPHGGAKSVIAASYFNRLAHERRLPFIGVAAATEEPYNRVPAPVAAALAKEGFDVSDYRPRRFEKEDIVHSLRIVAIDGDLSRTETGSLLAERWEDVPKVSEDLPGAMRAIRRHIEELVQEIGTPSTIRYTWAEDVGAPNDYVGSSIRTCIPP